VGNEDGTPSGPADSLGVPAAMPHAAAAAHQIGPIPRDEVRERVIRGTLALAKKQRTWFKRNSSIQWVTDRSNAVEIVTTFLNKTN
jgi:tRNA A37 N6-isopentenylltransferase MiaA